MTRFGQQRGWLRLISAAALFAYLAVLGCAHMHVAFEAHHNSAAMSHAQSHCHTGTQDGRAPHSAADHELAESIASRPKEDAPKIVMESAAMPPLSFEPGQRVAAIPAPTNFPKHPPPKQPGQPRSPPLT